MIYKFEIWSNGITIGTIGLYDALGRYKYEVVAQKAYLFPSLNWLNEI